jgi:hypothetical protein
MDDGDRIDAIVIDFSKAFDLVPHDRLLILNVVWLLLNVVCCNSMLFGLLIVVWLLFVSFYVLFVCKCVLPPGDNPIAVNEYINISTCVAAPSVQRIGKMEMDNFFFCTIFFGEGVIYGALAVLWCSNLPPDSQALLGPFREEAKRNFVASSQESNRVRSAHSL